MKTTSTAIETPTLVLPQNTAPWILPNSLEEGTLEKIPRLQSGKKTRENQDNFDALQQDLLNLEGQRWKAGVVFPKQAFRCRPGAGGGARCRPGPPRGEKRITVECLSPEAEETQIKKCTNEFGQNVLRYSRNHSTPVRIEFADF